MARGICMKNDWRQKLHLEPAKGWLNDPNGLSFFGGYYHVYFQYSPESALGKGQKCWGHFRSKNLTDWEFTGTVLFPDIAEDRSGVYSGCGFVKGDALYLYYTGNVKEEGDFDYINEGRGANVILVTTRDGHHMSEKKVLLKNDDYPAYCSCHVRDPKVWEEGGVYKMVLGARKRDDTGCVLLYTSSDLYDWKFERVIERPDFGYMWECPDMFRMGEREYLSISPQGLEHTEYTHQNVYSSGYFADEEMENFEEWDYGFDFYAPQTFEAPDGRRLLIGWMGSGDIPYTNPTTLSGWQHCLTLPREITVSDTGLLLQNPMRELERLRGEARNFAAGEKIETELPFEMTGEIDHPEKQTFTIDLGAYLRLQYQDDIFSILFTDDQTGCGRKRRNVKIKDCKKIRVIADTSSLEIYLDDGQKVLSTRFYPEDTKGEISVENLQGVWYPLKGMEVSGLG